MKFLLLLIATTCLFAAGICDLENVSAVVGASGEDASTEQSTAAFQALKQKASELFNEYMSQHSTIQTEVIYEYIYTKYETLNEKLQRIACKWNSDLLAAKTDALNELQQTSEQLHHSTTIAIHKLCSITTTIDIDLYINPELQHDYDLAKHQVALSMFLSNSYNIFGYTEVFVEYHNEIDGDHVTIGSLKNYVHKLESLLASLRNDIKSRAHQYISIMAYIIYYFEMRGQEKIQIYQSLLDSVDADFQHCVYSYGSYN